MSGSKMGADVRAKTRAAGRPVVPLVAGMVDRELARLTTAEDTNGLRLRVLFRMFDQSQSDPPGDRTWVMRDCGHPASPN